MARKKGNKKNNRRKLLTKLSRGGFTKKEVKRVSRKLNIKPKKAARVTSRFTKKNSLNINKNIDFKKTSTNKGPLKTTYTPPTPPTPPTLPTIPEQIQAAAPKVGGPNTPTKPETPYNDNKDLIEQLMGQYDNSAYMDQIKGLQGTISNLETKVGGYQTELNTLGDQYKDMELDQAQFKTGDSQYLTNNNSRGVRLRRSKNKNLFALGTGQFNRKNRSKNLAIGNVNL